MYVLVGVPDVAQVYIFILSRYSYSHRLSALAIKSWLAVVPGVVRFYIKRNYNVYPQLILCKENTMNPNMFVYIKGYCTVYRDGGGGNVPSFPFVSKS